MKFYDILKWLIFFNLTLLLLNAIGCSTFIQTFQGMRVETLIAAIGVTSLGVGGIVSIAGAMLYGVQGSLQVAVLFSLGTAYTFLTTLNFSIFNSLFLGNSVVQLFWGIFGIGILLAGYAGIAQLASQGWKTLQ